MQLAQPLTLKQTCDLLQAKYFGPPDFLITGINEIHMVERGDLTFVDHPKYYDKALKSAATTIIINQQADCPEGKALIFSDDPFRDFVWLINKFRPFQPSSQMISPSAKIGKGTILQPGVFVGNHVVIGENCLIHPHVTIYDHTIIGNNVIIHSGSVIGSDGLYYKRRSTHYDKLVSGGRVVIEDNVEIGASCTIDRGSTGDTTIGWGTKFDNQIHVGHDTKIGRNCLFAAQVGIAGCVVIENDVILWGQVGVQKDLTIKKGTIVLGQSGVTKTLEAGKPYFGTPAQDSREFLKQLASLRKLPELMDKLKSLETKNPD
ncbi:MAG TPA: UDP-3-O-(3-hydroxymyristoyl)glucosamine N-acyltransferase [Bacteroidales bacterium]|nr:UDP-3-O-(3-hydroxymyristoyl)glucosamine N-acyltransferase [Bacteroidales bacterium]